MISVSFFGFFILTFPSAGLAATTFSPPPVNITIPALTPQSGAALQPLTEPLNRSVDKNFLGSLFGLGSTVSGLITVQGETITVFRVEGAPNTRLLLSQGGIVDVVEKVNGEYRTLWLNFGDKERALDFFHQKVSGGLENPAIKSFEVRKTFLEDLKKIAVQERDARLYPNSPIIGEQGAISNQLGLRKDQFGRLSDEIIQGTGQKFTPAQALRNYQLSTARRLDNYLAGKFGPAAEWLNRGIGKVFSPLTRAGRAASGFASKTFPTFISSLGKAVSSPTAKALGGFLAKVGGAALALGAIYFGVTGGISQTAELINMIGKDGVGVLGTRKGAATGLRAASDWLLAISGGAATASIVTSWTGVGGVGFGAVAAVTGVASLATGAAAWLVDGGAAQVANAVGAATNAVGSAVSEAWNSLWNW